MIRTAYRLTAAWICLFAAAVMFPESTEKTEIGLRVVRAGENLQLIWNVPIPGANGALLVIRDGATRKEMLIDDELLQGGVFIYANPRTESVEFHLQIFTKSGQTITATARSGSV